MGLECTDMAGKLNGYLNSSVVFCHPGPTTPGYTAGILDRITHRPQYGMDNHHTIEENTNIPPEDSSLVTG
jgi:hypothetical protein